MECPVIGIYECFNEFQWRWGLTCVMSSLIHHKWAYYMEFEKSGEQN